MQASFTLNKQISTKAQRHDNRVGCVCVCLCVCMRQCVLAVVCAVEMYVCVGCVCVRVCGVCVCTCVSVLTVPGPTQFPVNSYQNVLQAVLADLSRSRCVCTCVCVCGSGICVVVCVGVSKCCKLSASPKTGNIFSITTRHNTRVAATMCPACVANSSSSIDAQEHTQAHQYTHT